MTDDQKKLLYAQEVEGVENLEIGADGERFYLDIVEEDGPGGIRVELTSSEREAIRSRFEIPERSTDEEQTDQDLCSECGSKLADGECFVCDEYVDDTNELADSESNKANQLADLEPAVLAIYDEHEEKYVTFTRPEGSIGEAWRDADRDFDELFAAEDIIQLIEKRIEAIETHLEEYDAEESPEEDWVVGRKAQIRELENLRDQVKRSKTDS